jgi:hypothetical protein
VRWIAAGYAPGHVNLHNLATVSFSLSTFLCLAASWTGLMKKSALHAQKKMSAMNILQAIKIYSRWTQKEVASL